MLNQISNSKIFITGGAGFIGSHLVEALLPHGPAKILLLDNLVRGSYENMERFLHHPAVEFVEGDIRDTKLLDRCMEGMDYVFHMAALRINACAAHPKSGFDTMLKATFELAESCVKHKIRKLIYSSSASVYGLAQHFPTPETDNPYNNQTFYGGAKLWGEQLFRTYKFMYGLDYVALRYFNVYGPRMDTDGRYTEVMIRWLECLLADKEPVIHGDGSNSMDFVYVKDVAEANIAALMSDVTDEAFNIGSGEETSLKQLLQALLTVNHSSLLPVCTGENTVNPVGRRLADISKAKALLGFAPSVRLKEGLAALSQWYIEKQTAKVG